MAVALKAKPALNARQAEFVRHYTAGADGVRGNATQAYRAAGYTSRAAEVEAAKLVRNPKVRAAIAVAHAAAEGGAARKLKDWKDLAVDAQQRTESLAAGFLPDPANGGREARICDRDTAAVGKLLLQANLALIERGYPQKLQLEHSGRIDGRLAVTVIYEDKKTDDSGAMAEAAE